VPRRLGRQLRIYMSIAGGRRRPDMNSDVHAAGWNPVLD